jgi:hypothetical protein
MDASVVAAAVAAVVEARRKRTPAARSGRGRGICLFVRLNVS